MEEYIITIFGAILSLFLGVVFNDPLKNLLATIVIKTGRIRYHDINNVWVAKYTTSSSNNSGKEYIEVLEVKTFFGQVVGRIIPHHLNDDISNRILKKSNIRLRGTIRNNLTFSGVWFSPVFTGQDNGAFHMKISEDGNTISGAWIGYSHYMQKVVDGKWEWKKLTN